MKKRKNKQLSKSKQNLTPEQIKGYILLLKKTLKDFENDTNILETKANALRIIGDIYGEDSSQYEGLSGVDAMLFRSNPSSNIQSFKSRILQTIFELDPTETLGG